MKSAMGAVVSAALYALALPPMGASALGWVALAPFFIALSRATPASGFALRLLWFFTASMGFASGLPHPLSTYFVAPGGRRTPGLP